MKFTTQQYVEALYESIAEVKPEQHDTIISNFIAVLQKNGDIGQYEKIVEAYERYDRQQRGVKQVHVATAGEMEANKDILDSLNKIAGANIEITHSVDRSLIGGVVVKIDDTLIDGSVKRQLSNLNDALEQS